MSVLLEKQINGEPVVATGSLYFREANSSDEGAAAFKKRGKKLMMVVGVIAVSEDFQIEGESMVRLQGFAGKKELTFCLEPKGTTTGYEHYLGWEIGDLLTQPIWKA